MLKKLTFLFLVLSLCLPFVLVSCGDELTDEEIANANFQEADTALTLSMWLPASVEYTVDTNGDGVADQFNENFVTRLNAVEEAINDYLRSNAYCTEIDLVVVNEKDYYNQLSAKFDNINDLKGMSIGVQLGTTGDFIISDEINGYEDDGESVKGVLQDTGASITTYNNANLAAEALKSGKIQAVVIDKLPAELIAKNSNETLKAIELVYEDGSNTAEEYAICVAKGNDTLLEVVNTVIEKLIEEGKIDAFIVEHTTNALAD